MSRLLLALACCLALAACSRAGAPSDSDLPTLQLNDAVGDQIGGPDTCMVILDAKSGAVGYQYGLPSVCARQLPPCATFEIANALIGLDSGLVAPTTLFKWNGAAQPVSAWEKDADLQAAFRQSIAWWHQELATRIGAPLYAERLKAFGYGSAKPEGPLTRFWMGPAQGGTLGISTRQQADFLRRLYAGTLPVKPAVAVAVQGMMPSETRGAVTFAGKAGSCDSIGDSSRSVGWSVGRLSSPDRDLIFAASIEGQNAFPGFEVENRVKTAFADAGLWAGQ